MNASQVALVVAKIPGPEVYRLAKTMPIWIGESLIDAQTLSDLRDASAYGITTFLERRNDEKSASISRILYSLDEHHNEVSQEPPYSELHVFGANLREVDQAAFRELGFNRYDRTEFGFIAYKDEPSIISSPSSPRAE